jgi:hypothetical protein
MKKKWDKPELTVLVRGNAEEAVLSACKGGTTVGPGAPHACRATDQSCANNGCHGAVVPPACSAIAAS